MHQLAHFLDLFVNSRSARYEYHHPREKRQVCAARLSASLSWGKHRLSQEAGLFCDVLLHRSIVTEIPVFFQWYLLITVITHSYEPVCIRRSWRMLTRFLIVRNILLLSGRLPGGWSGLEGPDSAGHQESVPLLPITHVLRSCGYRSIRKRLGVRVFLEDVLSVLDGPDHRGISGKFSARRFVPSFVNFCTCTAWTPHISISAAASDSGGFAFFRARQIVLPSTSPDIERFPVRKTFGIRSSASSDCESEKHCKYCN